MRQKIAPGAEVEFVTPAELDAAIDRLQARGGDVRLVRTAEDGVTDASGALALPILKVAAGFEFALGTILVRSAAATPGAPTTNAAGFLELTRNDSPVDFAPNPASAAGLVLPFEKGYSGHNARRFRNGDALGVKITGGPVSTGITVYIEGVEYRAELGREGNT